LRDSLTPDRQSSQNRGEKRSSFAPIFKENEKRSVEQASKPRADRIDARTVSGIIASVESGHFRPKQLSAVEGSQTSTCISHLQASDESFAACDLSRIRTLLARVGLVGLESAPGGA
jgi:hypothetical protein